MTRVGIIGLGMMGLTHLDIYRQREDVIVTALCDIDADRLHGRTRATGNIEGQAQSGAGGIEVKRYENADELITDADVDVVDICLPTDLHVSYAIEALEAGKHVVVEKPLGRTAAEARRLADVASSAKGFAFAAHCMRFWPGWTDVKQAVADGRYGKVLAATFRRVASPPTGTFYMDGDRSGGAILDLHIHDTDFIRHVFGIPTAVQATGYSKITGEIDHVVTRYVYGDAGPMIVAEGGWAMADGFGFSMAYTINFEHATLVYNSAVKPAMMLYQNGEKPKAVELDPRMGYAVEIEYFLNCIANAQPPRTITIQQAADAVAIVEAERQSIAKGRAIEVTLG